MDINYVIGNVFSIPDTLTHAHTQQHKQLCWFISSCRSWYVCIFNHATPKPHVHRCKKNKAQDSRQSNTQDRTPQRNNPQAPKLRETVPRQAPAPESSEKQIPMQHLRLAGTKLQHPRQEPAPEFVRETDSNATRAVTKQHYPRQS